MSFFNQSFRHVVLGEATQPEAYSNEEWKGLAGAGGKTLNFTIRYRSRGIYNAVHVAKSH